jgi:hypothetical protein
MVLEYIEHTMSKYILLLVAVAKGQTSAPTIPPTIAPPADGYPFPVSGIYDCPGMAICADVGNSAYYCKTHNVYPLFTTLTLIP